MLLRLLCESLENGLSSLVSAQLKKKEIKIESMWTDAAK